MDLKELRRMADLTQFQLAQRCGVSRMRLSLAECGQLELNANEERAVRKTLMGVIEHRSDQLKGVLGALSGKEAVAV
jgi:transcriptional regulator with XRE-family HTH domain